MDDPTAAKVSLVCLRPIPKLDRGAPISSRQPHTPHAHPNSQERQRGRSVWSSASTGAPRQAPGPTLHVPTRTQDGRTHADARQSQRSQIEGKCRAVPGHYRDDARYGRRLFGHDVRPPRPPGTRRHLTAHRSTPDQKRAFFGLCAASIVERINSFDATNARVTFISSDGKVHRSSFDENGRLEYTVEQRTVGYGEADLSVPLEMAAAGPGVHWELWTIGAAKPGFCWRRR